MKRPEFFPTRDYLCNHIVSCIPLLALRMAAYRVLGVNIGDDTTLMMGIEMHHAGEITIGRNTVVNPHCHLDGRGGLVIGDNVNISAHVLLVAGSHDIHDGHGFAGRTERIVVDDYAWLCTRCLILPGVHVGCGAVVAAGAVVTRSVPPFTVVAGVPAKKIGERSRELAYKLVYPVSWQ